MGKRSRLKAERKKAQQRAGGLGPGEKYGGFPDMVEDIVTFQRRMTKAARQKAKLTIVAHKDDPDVQTGVTCDTCTAPKGCCRQAIYVDLYEALPIAQRLQKRGLDTPQLRERLKRQGEEIEGTARAEWLDRMVPCVFLAEDERCSIYAARPLPCRTYLVFSDPALCSAPSGEVTKQVDIHFLIGEQAHMGKGIHAALGLPESENRIYMCSLPRAVWLILEFWGRDDFVARINDQPWPTMGGISKWMNGDNPYRNKNHNTVLKQE